MQFNNNYANNQQIVGDNATAVGFFSSSQPCGIQDIRKLIKENCTEEQANALLSVISEMEESVQSGVAGAKDSKKWTGRLQTALSAVESVAVISKAPWWPVLIDRVQNFINHVQV